MTVADLIELLEQQDPNAEIILDVQNVWNYVFDPKIETGADRDACGYPSRGGIDHDPRIVRLTN